METLKIAYCDFWPEWNQEDFITPILKKYFNVIIDQTNPDILIHSIFGNTQMKYKCKKILYVAENIRYPYNAQIRANINSAYTNANYTITYDPSNDTNFRLPLWQVFILRNPNYLDSLLNKVKHKEFDRFASFTVSNGSNFIRNGMFQQLSQYKHVYSYGKYMTNSYELQNLTNDRYWRDVKDDFFMKYRHKFAITYENTSYPYYCTEKLMDSFLVGSVPIYWGDPKIKQDWNPAAFINVNDFGSNIINKIKELDNNNFYFEEIYNQPVFTPEQKDKLTNNLGEFETWLIKHIK